MIRLILLSLLLLSSIAFIGAQTNPDREDQARRDLEYGSPGNQAPRSDRFGDNLWFGGGLQLGFTGGTFQSFFNIGLSPMVGYKLNNTFSVGPRVAFSYNSFKQRNTTSDFTSNYFTWAAGIFGRARIINPFFAHVEYSLESDVIGFNPTTNDPVRRNRGVPYIGAGYSPFNPGGASSEILVLFRLNQQAQFIAESPFVIRAGINFNF